MDILGRLRKGAFDALIGVNLLREGLDLPEVTLVAILDADKEGFLRSETSLIQTAGRCARNVEGKVILYADHPTPAIEALLAVTEAHREKQQAYNSAHGITPHTVRRAINEELGADAERGAGSSKRRGKRGGAVGADAFARVARGEATAQEAEETLKRIEEEMRQAAESLEFERAALLRDELRALRRRLEGSGK